ncbi:unnamed protein product [Cylicocyclus nassatus]|uniref:Uncharacterized protein n=1 Tax=Cylicocyclus nassatus TaxID=53992 RepID=A0AA36M485_CYLNA|nr:unnamed protein product [Cylicocyclus nassatus]
MHVFLIVVCFVFIGETYAFVLPSLFSLFRWHRQKAAARAKKLKNATTEILIEKLRKDIEDLKRQSEFGYDRTLPASCTDLVIFSCMSSCSQGNRIFQSSLIYRISTVVSLEQRNVSSSVLHQFSFEKLTVCLEKLDK